MCETIFKAPSNENGLKWFEKSELLALSADLKDRESPEQTDVVLIFGREECEGEEEGKG